MWNFLLPVAPGIGRCVRPIVIIGIGLILIFSAAALLVHIITEIPPFPPLLTFVSTILLDPWPLVWDIFFFVGTILFDLWFLVWAFFFGVLGFALVAHAFHPVDKPAYEDWGMGFYLFILFLIVAIPLQHLFLALFRIDLWGMLIGDF